MKDGLRDVVFVLVEFLISSLRDREIPINFPAA